MYIINSIPHIHRSIKCVWFTCTHDYVNFYRKAHIPSSSPWKMNQTKKSSLVWNEFLVVKFSKKKKTLNNNKFVSQLPQLFFFIFSLPLNEFIRSTLKKKKKKNPEEFFCHQLCKVRRKKIVVLTQQQRKKKSQSSLKIVYARIVRDMQLLKIELPTIVQMARGIAADFRRNFILFNSSSCVWCVNIYTNQFNRIDIINGIFFTLKKKIFQIAKEQT